MAKEKIKKSLLLWNLGVINKEKLMEEIWHSYHPKLQVYIQSFYRGDEEIVDLVSEILLRSFEKLEFYNSDYAFSTWIYTMARNYTIDRMRKKQVFSVALDGQETTDEYSPEAMQMKTLSKEIIRQAVAELDPVNRELVFLHFYEEMTYRDISLIMGMPEGTIKYRMSESRKKLKRILEGRLIS